MNPQGDCQFSLRCRYCKHLPRTRNVKLSVAGFFSNQSGGRASPLLNLHSIGFRATNIFFAPTDVLCSRLTSMVDSLRVLRVITHGR